MSADIPLFQIRPGEQYTSGPSVGRFYVGGVGFSGGTLQSQRCLDINVEARPSVPSSTLNVRGVEVSPFYEWLQLEAKIWTNSIPRYQVGLVHIEQAGMLTLGKSDSMPATWLWELRPEDVEAVEEACANATYSSIPLLVEIGGIAKIIHPATSQLIDIVRIEGVARQFAIEHSLWEQILQWLEYRLPPSQLALAGRSTKEHGSWQEAANKLEGARKHLRSGDGYESLWGCLSVLEGLVSAPYRKDAWLSQLVGMSEQKATGIAELFSGMAEYLNKIGHHRSRDERDGSDDLVQMPLNQWEAELVLGAAQFVTTYALRLRMTGNLTSESSPSEKT